MIVNCSVNHSKVLFWRRKRTETQIVIFHAHLQLDRGKDLETRDLLCSLKLLYFVLLFPQCRDKAHTFSRAFWSAAPTTESLADRQGWEPRVLSVASAFLPLFPFIACFSGFLVQVIPTYKDYVYKDNDEESLWSNELSTGQISYSNEDLISYIAP